jgi:hypothetical protein
MVGGEVLVHKYFDSIPHSHLRTFLDQRVTDGVIRRMIDKWLKAGAVAAAPDDIPIRPPTPPAGVLSSTLSVWLLILRLRFRYVCSSLPPNSMAEIGSGLVGMPSSWRFQETISIG